jgi:hypothetical protein
MWSHSLSHSGFANRRQPWAWGDNGWGQLGTGTLDDANTPQPVLGAAVSGPP